MSEPLRMGLIGMSGIGNSHFQKLKALESEGLLRMVHVADPALEKFEELRVKLDAEGIRWHLDFQRLIGEEDLEAVAIAAPVHLHAKMTAAALARGLFVHLDTPPVSLIQQLDALIALDARHKVAVGFHNLKSPLFQQLKQWRLEGALGEIQSIHVSAAWPRLAAHYRQDWAGKMMLDGEPVFDGPFTGELSVLVHAIMFLAGNTMEGFDLPSEVEGEFYRTRPMEGYDMAAIRGKLESGISFHCVAAHAIEKPKPYCIEVIGHRGRAWVSDDGVALGNNCGLTTTAEPNDSLLASYREFVEFARGDCNRPTSLLEDSRGYILATNGALVASNGIHTIDSKHVRVYGKGDEEGHALQKTPDLLDRCTLEFKLFSELEVPWARKSEAVLVRGLRSLKLRDYISH